jgi:two-component system, NarL family, nitrate/nitrite response regulator NarL
MGKRVLVADDDAGWRYILTRFLEPDCTVIGYVERGDELVAAAGQLLPDVITLDISMPGKSGLKALPELRQLLPDATIVIVTASIDPLYREEAFRRGADAYISKSRVSTDLKTEVSPPRDCPVEMRITQR